MNAFDSILAIIKTASRPAETSLWIGRGDGDAFTFTRTGSRWALRINGGDPLYYAEVGRSDGRAEFHAEGAPDDRLLIDGGKLSLSEGDGWIVMATGQYRSPE